MIESFADKETKILWETGKNRRMPPDVARRTLVKLQSLNAADNIERMGLPPANRLKRLGGDKKEYWSVRVNDQWRIIFRFEDGNAFDVSLIDYH